MAPPGGVRARRLVLLEPAQDAGPAAAVLHLPHAPARRPGQGRAVQIDPLKPKLKPPGTYRLKLNCYVLLSASAFKINLRRYTKANAAQADYLFQPDKNNAGADLGRAWQILLATSMNEGSKCVSMTRWTMFAGPYNLGIGPFSAGAKRTRSRSGWRGSTAATPGGRTWWTAPSGWPRRWRRWCGRARARTAPSPSPRPPAAPTSASGTAPHNLLKPSFNTFANPRFLLQKLPFMVSRFFSRLHGGRTRTRGQDPDEFARNIISIFANPCLLSETCHPVMF